MHLVTAVLKRCAKKDVKNGKEWCIYKHSAQDHTKIIHPQPKGWPKHYASQEKAKRGLKMMKTFGHVIQALHKVGASHLVNRIIAYEAPVTYPRVWTPDPTHTPGPKENARDSSKSYNNPGTPLGVQYLSEDWLSKMGFTDEAPSCPNCGLQFAERYAYCPECGNPNPSGPKNSLRSVQEQDVASVCKIK